MASKARPSRSTGSDAGGAGALRAEAERLIARERYKDAVKQAKLCYKEQATPEHHRLLERAYFLRARQLLQQGMRSSAAEVAQHLIDFGVTGADSPEELVRLLAALGFGTAAMAVQERLGVPGLGDQVTRTVADQLVIHADRTGAASPELIRDAQLVRRALEALQAGDEPSAMGMLRDLPRSSPLSEWRLFARGLAAFERGDDAEARAGWDRLDPARAPARIAGRLRRMAEETAGSAGAGLESAEKLVFGEPILDRIRQIGPLLAGHEWSKGLTLLGEVLQVLRRIDPALPERLTRVLIGSVIKAVQGMDWNEAQSLVLRFCRVAEPLEIDPHWNRFWALVWDGPQAEPEGAIHYWSEYLKDLATLPAFTPAERALAQAIVWNHIAGLHCEEADALLADEFGPPGLAKALARGKKKPRRESREVVAAKKAVVEAIEKSVEIAPDYPETYRLLVSVHQRWHDAKGLEAGAQRLLERFPDDLETLQLLARHHFERQDHRAALPCVLHARRLRPLDDSLRTLEWMVHIGMARVYALERKWDEGRAEFAAADALTPGDRREFPYLARRAMLEYKAGQDEAGDRFVEQATARLIEPGPLWMVLLIESIRFKMPKARSDRYAKLWDAELKKKRRSETAGEMAGLMAAFLRADVEYTGRAGHIKKVLDYVRKTTALKYRREDIERVVEFLGELMPKEEALFKKLVKAGVKQHPDSPLLHLSAGGLELMETGPGVLFGARLPTAARRHLETALKLAEASTDPKTAALLPKIRERLSMLDEFQHSMAGFGFPFDGFPFGPGDAPGFDDLFGDDLDGDEGEDEEGPFTLDFGPPPARGRPAGGGKSKPKRGGRKKRRADR